MDPNFWWTSQKHKFWDFLQVRDVVHVYPVSFFIRVDEHRNPKKISSGWMINAHWASQKYKYRDHLVWRLTIKPRGRQYPLSNVVIVLCFTHRAHICSVLHICYIFEVCYTYSSYLPRITRIYRGRKIVMWRNFGLLYITDVDKSVHMSINFSTCAVISINFFHIYHVC